MAASVLDDLDDPPRPRTPSRGLPAIDRTSEALLGLAFAVMAKPEDIGMLCVAAITAYTEGDQEVGVEIINDLLRDHDPHDVCQVLAGFGSALVLACGREGQLALQSLATINFED